MAEIDFNKKGVLPNSQDAKVKVKKAPKATSEIVSDETDAKPEDSTIIDVDSDNIIKMSSDKRAQIETMLHRDISETILKDSGVRSKCVESHEMYEGVPSRSSTEHNSSHFELDDGPGIRCHYGTVAVQGKVHRYIQSMFGVAPWITVNLFDKKDQIKSQRRADCIQDWLQVHNEKILKLKKKARMIATNTGIESVGISSLVWERRTKPERGVESYDNLESFVAEYPSAESSGISDAEYAGYVKALTPIQIPLQSVIPPVSADGVVPPVMPPLATEKPAGGPAVAPVQSQPVKPISIRYKKNKIVYDFCRVDVVNRSKFGLIPYNATFDKARGKFIELDMTWNDLAKGYSEGRYTNIETVKARAGSGSGEQTGEVEQAQASNEGKSDENSQENYKTVNYKVYRVMYMIDIDDDGLDELCIFTYALNQKTLIRAEYWDDNWFLTPHYIEEKSNRFEGIGIIDKERNIIKEADEFINLRMKAGKLAVTPSFKAKKGSAFDPGLQYFYPGVIWWLDDMNEVEQWTINVNLPEGFNEEASLERKHELLTGMTAGLSGRELPQDPNAPGVKMALLNREGNVLINGDIDVFRDSIEELAYNIITMAAKYLPEDDKYLRLFGLTKEDLKIAREEISLFGTSLSHNPEMIKQESAQAMQMFLNNPVVQADIESVRKITYDTMEAWGLDADRILPTAEQLFQKQVDIQAAAMRKIQEEIARKKDEDTFKQHLMDLGLSEDRADARLKQWRNIEGNMKSPVPEDTREEMETAVPM